MNLKLLLKNTVLKKMPAPVGYISMRACSQGTHSVYETSLVKQKTVNYCSLGNVLFSKLKTAQQKI